MNPATDDQPTVLSANRPKSAAGPAIVPGSLLGPYQLLEPIGVGGMAAVFKALDPQLDRLVALKVLPPDAAADADSVERFRREARAAAKLDHDNVAGVYQFGHDQDLYYIAFEYVEGINLRDLLHRDGPLSIAEGTRFLVEVARGLAHAASRGVVHRDLKPSNIILDTTGRAKIVDMGLARETEAAGQVTQSGVTLGTFDYIAPEQALDPRTADVRSDIYSLGCTFYHAFTGQVPVPEGTAAMKLHHHQHVAPIDPQALNPNIPTELAGILARMMAKNPGDRFSTADELLRELETFARSLGLECVTSGAEHPGIRGSVAPSPRRSAAPLWAALAVTAAVLLGEVLAPRPPAGELQTAALQLLAPPETAPPPLPVPRAPAIGVSEAETVEELAELLRQPVARIRLTGSEYHIDDEWLDGDSDAALTFEGRSLVMTAADPTKPPVIRVSAANGAGPRTVFAVEGDGRTSVVVRGVRFRFDRAGPGSAVVAIRAAERVEFDQCTWEAAVVGDGPATSLRVEPDRAARDPADVRVTQCQFFAGGTAIELAGRTAVQLAHTAFAPHAVFARCRGTANFRLENCTAMLDGGTVFAFEDGAGGVVRCGECVFARGAGDATAGREAVLVRKTGGRAEVAVRSAVAADGTPARNLIHRLGAVWVEETADGEIRAGTIEDAKRLKLPIDGDFIGSRDFTGSRDYIGSRGTPWESPDPVAKLSDDPRAAFALSVVEAANRGTAGMLGTHLLAAARLYPNPLPELKPDAVPVVRSRIVDPARDTDSRGGVYRTLAQAIPDTIPGDTILIRANGPVEIAPLRLEDAGTRLTLKPYPGFRPELVLAPTSAANPTVFHLSDGRLSLEALQIRLAVPPDGLTPNGLVALGGAGRCELRQCVVTLLADGDVRPFVAACPEAEGDSRASPALVLEQCFVRGRGHLLTADVNRRFDVAMTESVVAVDGDLIAATGVWHGKATAGPLLEIARSTVIGGVYAEPAVRSADTSARLPLRVEARSCAFDTPAGRLLFNLVGPRTADELAGRLRWSGSRSLFLTTAAETAVESVDPADVDRPPMRWDFARWAKWLPPGATEEGPAQFASRIDGAALGQALPEDFRLIWPDGSTRSDVVGARVDQLPAPVGEMPRGPLP